MRSRCRRRDFINRQRRYREQGRLRQGQHIGRYLRRHLLVFFQLYREVNIFTALFGAGNPAFMRVLIMPQAYVHQLFRTVVHMESGAGGSAHVEQGQYECEELLHALQK